MPLASALAKNMHAECISMADHCESWRGGGYEILAESVLCGITLQLISHNFSVNVANFVRNFVVKFKSSY
jgi:hypothetical protein